MNTTINLGVKKKGTTSYILQLSNNARKELFFRPLWNQIKPSHFYDGIDNSDRDIRNIDHISFHEDGTIHFIIKDAAGYRDKISDRKLVNTIATIPKDGYGVLFIYSTYDFSLVKTYLSRSTALTFQDTKNVNLEFEYHEIDQFSLVLFLLGANVDAKLMLQSHFKNIFNPGNSICIEDYLVDQKDPSNYLQLLVASTTKVIPKPSSNALDGSKRIKSFIKIENPMGISFACSDDKINQMV